MTSGGAFYRKSIFSRAIESLVRKRTQKLEVENKSLKAELAGLRLACQKEQNYLHALEMRLSERSTQFTYIISDLREKIEQLQTSEAELKLSRANMKAFLEAIPDIIFRVSVDGTIRDCITGRPENLIIDKDNITGENITALVDDQLVKMMQNTLLEVNRLKQPRMIQYPTEAQGRTRFEEARLVPFQNEEVIVIVRDITQKVKMEKDLVESEIRFREMAESIQDGIVIVEGGKIVYTNSRILEIFECTNEEFVRRGDIGFASVSESQRLQSILEECESRGYPPRELEFWIRTGSGALKCVNNKYSLVMKNDKEVLYIIVSDITLRRISEEKIENHLERLLSLYRLTISVNRAENLDSIYQSALRMISQFFCADKSAVLLADESGKMHYMHWQNLSEQYRLQTDGFSPWKEGEDNPRPYIVEDLEGYREDKFWAKYTCLLLDEGVRSIACIPLVAGGRIIGRFMVYFKEPHGYPAEEVSMMQTIAGIVSFAIERARAEEVIRLSEERFRSLFEGDLTGMYFSTPEGRILHCNQPFARILGFETVENVLNVNAYDLYADAEVRKSIIKKLRKRKKIEFCESQLIRSDGSLVDVIENMFGIFDSEGNLIEMRGFLYDDTKRKRAENALMRLNSRLEAEVEKRVAEIKFLFDRTPVAMAFFDSSGEMINCNPQWSKFWREDIKNMNMPGFLESVCPVLSREELKDEIQRVFKGYTDHYQTGAVHFGTEDSIYFSNMSEKWLAWSFYFQKNTVRNRSRIAITIEDVTLAKRTEIIARNLEQEKAISAAIMETTDKERGRISRELHDSVGQLISAAKLNIEIFEKKSQTADVSLAEAKKYTIEAGMELKNIIRSLHPSSLYKLGLCKAIDNLVSETAGTTGITFTVNHFGLSGITDSNIQLNIYRILQEGLNNIAKHSMASEALVQLFKRKDALSIVISDNGVGFDVSEKEALNESALNFGLRNIKERTKILGGYCQIEAMPGRGTEINIEIPFKEIKYGKN